MKNTSLTALLISTILFSANAYAADNGLQVPDSLGKVADFGDKASEKLSDTANEVEKSAAKGDLPDLSSIPALPKDLNKEADAKTDSASEPPPIALPEPKAEVAAEKKELPALPGEPVKATTTEAVAKPAAAAEPAKPAEPAKLAEPAKPTEPAKLAEPAKAAEPVKPAEPPTSAAMPSMTLPPPGSFPKLPTPASLALPSPDGSPVIPTGEAPPEQTATSAAPVDAAPNTTIDKSVTDAPKKVTKRKKVKPVDMTKRYKNRLPATIYATSYPKGNKHLPLARYEQDLDAQVFGVIAKDNINGLRGLLDYSKRNINKPNAAGDTPLIAAVKSNAINSVRILIGRKADMNARDAQGLTALDNAKRLGLYRIERALTIMATESEKVAVNAPVAHKAAPFSPLEITQ